MVVLPPVDYSIDPYLPKDGDQKPQPTPQPIVVQQPAVVAAASVALSAEQAARVDAQQPPEAVTQPTSGKIKRFFQRLAWWNKPRPAVIALPVAPNPSVPPASIQPIVHVLPVVNHEGSLSSVFLGIVIVSAVLAGLWFAKNYLFAPTVINIAPKSKRQPSPATQPQDKAATPPTKTDGLKADAAEKPAEKHEVSEERFVEVKFDIEVPQQNTDGCIWLYHTFPGQNSWTENASDLTRGHHPFPGTLPWCMIKIPIEYVNGKTEIIDGSWNANGDKKCFSPTELSSRKIKPAGFYGNEIEHVWDGYKLPESLSFEWWYYQDQNKLRLPYSLGKATRLYISRLHPQEMAALTQKSPLP